MENCAGTQELQRGLEAKFALLKHRLVLERLDGTPEIEAHALIIRQADEAALAARLSSYPLLAFPCLFEEKAAAVTAQVRAEASRYWHRLESGAAARAAWFGAPSLTTSRPSSAHNSPLPFPFLPFFPSRRVGFILAPCLTSI